MNSRPIKAASRPHQRGFTIIELMVGFTIAILLTLAAVSFAAHETRLMGVSRDRLDLAQASRAAIDMVAEDLRMAGAGIGYRSDGEFGGIRLNRFNIGVATFNPNGGPATPYNPGVGTGPGVFADLGLTEKGARGADGPAFASFSTDVAIVSAQGAYATIADYNPAGGGMFCNSPEANFAVGETVILRSQSTFDAFAATITPLAAGVCNLSNGHDCVNGCRAFSFVADTTTFNTDGTASSHSYLGGEISGGVQTVVWFAVDVGSTATLRRMVFQNGVDCDGAGGRNNGCGSAVVNDVEAFIVQAWAFDPTAGPLGSWINAGQAPITNRDRVRVDVELVMRSQKSSERQTFPVDLNLLPAPDNCLPIGATCGEPGDFGLRRVLRTSVELKNSGRMQLN